MRVVVYGTVSDILGYSTAARSLIHSLHSAGIDLAVVDLSFRKNVTDPLVCSLLERKFSPDFHIFCGMPTFLPLLTWSSDRVISHTVWETDSIPRSWVPCLNKTCDVWVPSSHNAEIFRASLEAPVFRCPHALNPSFDPQCSPDPIQLPGIGDSDFVFYSVLVWQDRKHPFGVIEAFLRAFPGDADVALVIKAQYAAEMHDSIMGTIAALRQKHESNARVEIINEVWTSAQIQALMQRGNCYVSLHRGEGWGYPLIDAACLGKPVLATAHSGPLDYLRPENHYLVNYSECPVMQSYTFYDQSMRWANPDLNDATAKMQYIYSHRVEATQRAQAGVARLLREYSYETVGKRAKDRLEQLVDNAGSSSKIQPDAAIPSSRSAQTANRVEDGSWS